MFPTTTVQKAGLFAALALFATLALAPAVTPAAANDAVEVTRPNCPACDSARKKLDGAEATVNRTKKRLREEDLSDRQIRALDKVVDKNKAVATANARKLNDCKNGCPASLRVSVKPVSIKSCKACQSLAGKMVSGHVEVSERVDEDRRGIEQDGCEPGRCPVEADVQHDDLDREEHPEQGQRAGLSRQRLEADPALASPGP